MNTVRHLIADEDTRKDDRPSTYEFFSLRSQAARMESNGKRDSIQISEQTANLLIAAGKSYWIQQREDKIIAKGTCKGDYAVERTIFEFL